MTDLMTPQPGAEPAGALCDLEGCTVRVPLSERGRPRRFCTDAHARAWHNAHRSTGRPAAPAPAGGAGETADAWTLLLQVGDQLPRLVKEIRAERQALEP